MLLTTTWKKAPDSAVAESGYVFTRGVVQVAVSLADVVTRSARHSRFLADALELKGQPKHPCLHHYGCFLW